MFRAETLRRGCVTDRQTDRDTAALQSRAKSVGAAVQDTDCLPLQLYYGRDCAEFNLWWWGWGVTSVFWRTRKVKVKMYLGTP